MTNTELYQWIADPTLLTHSTLQELKQMVEEYPCFHAVRILYLKNLAILDDIRLDKEVKKMAIFIPDRRQLFLHLRDINKWRQRPSKKHEEKPHFMDKIITSGGNLGENSGEATKKRPSSDVQPSLAADYVNWLETNVADLPKANSTESRLKHQELIDTFIANENKRSGNRLSASSGEKKPEPENVATEPDSAVKKNDLDESYFTETLARVYIAQKQYEKALEIIRVLNLKYPEKSTYFASLIQYLEKVINIKK
jgi:hypothetical protein